MFTLDVALGLAVVVVAVVGVFVAFVPFARVVETCGVAVAVVVVVGKTATTALVASTLISATGLLGAKAPEIPLKLAGASGEVLDATTM